MAFGILKVSVCPMRDPSFPKVPTLTVHIYLRQLRGLAIFPRPAYALGTCGAESRDTIAIDLAIIASSGGGK